MPYIIKEKKLYSADYVTYDMGDETTLNKGAKMEVASIKEL